VTTAYTHRHGTAATLTLGASASSRHPGAGLQEKVNRLLDAGSLASSLTHAPANCDSAARGCDIKKQLLLLNELLGPVQPLEDILNRSFDFEDGTSEICVTMASDPANLKSEQPNQHVNVWSHPLFLVAVIVFASFAVRIAALIFWGTGAIDSEGTEYARIAQNLRNGVGYVGMTSPGRELVFPPVYPLLIDLASFFTRQYDWAGRVVSLVLGALLPLPVFGIASRLYNRRTGFVAAMLTVFFPLFVNLSFAVKSEGTYITLLLSAVYIVLCALDRPSVRIYCLMGLLFGLAYLTRQEAVAPLLIAVFLGICYGEGSFARRSKLAVAAIAVFVVLALPEVVYLYKSTGKIKLETKSSIFFAEQVRTNLGRENNEPDPEEWAQHSIDANLERTGTSNRPEADIVRETHITYGRLARILKTGMRKNIPILVEELSAGWLGAPFLPALALLGALRRPWKRLLVSKQLYILLVPLTAITATFTFTWTVPRYYFVLVPFLLIWAANGLVGVGLWTKATVDAAGWHWISPVITKGIVPGLVGLVLILSPLNAVRSLWEFRQDSRATQDIKQLGIWIGQQQNRQVLIMDRSTPLAFHANAEWVAFPYCDGDLALRFLDAAKVDYVILRGDEKYTAYYQDWLTNGIPDPRAERVSVTSTWDGSKLTVYRWHWNGSGSPVESKPTP
jgi:4-amino-4-deoxy-L-arabinose transferase-like glycosyltransferase